MRGSKLHRVTSIYVLMMIPSLWSCESNMQLKTSPVEMEKDCKDQCPKITKVFPLAAKPGETLSLSGENFTEGMTVVTASGEHPVTVISATEASISTPEGGPGEVMMAAKLNEYQDEETSFFRLALDYPLITDEPTEICAGKKFYNAKGELKEGTKNCSPDITGLKPEYIIEGVKIAGVEGKLPLCNDEGQKRCVTDGAFRSASITDLASKVVVGKKVAGVDGTAPSPPTCTSEGEVGCQTTTSLIPAFATGLADKVLAGQSVAGVSGNVTLPNATNVATGIQYGVGGTQFTGSGLTEVHSNCTGANQSGCVATSTYKTLDLSTVSGSGLTSGNFDTAIATASTFEFWDNTGARHTIDGDADLTAANIANGIEIHGKSGTANLETHATCTTDGGTGCIADATYTAALTTGLADKVLSGQTVAGVAGNIVLPAVGKVLTSTSYGISGTGLTGTLTLPAAGSVLASSGTFGDPLAAVTPTLTLPLASNVLTGSGTYGDPGSALTPSYSPDFPDVGNVLNTDTVNNANGTLTLPSAGNVHSVNGVFGVAGNGTTPTLANCTVDGSNGCVATVSYPAVNGGALVDSNIKTGVVIGGITGTYGGTGLAPDCASDGEIGCTTVTNFPAIDKNAAGLAAKIADGQTIASVTGTFAPDCSSDGQTDCRAVPAFKAAQISGFAAGNVQSGTTIAGVAGSLANCSAANQSGCVATTTYKTLDLSTVSGAGLTSANFDTSIATAATFEFWDAVGARHTVTGDADLVASNVKNSVEIHGVTGSVVETPGNCSSDGDTACVATATYTAALTTGLADKVLSGQTVAGVGGNITLPTAGDVESGVSYGIGGNGSTGTFAVPAVADVQASVQFGAGGTEFTGTFTEPGVGNVEAGVTYGGGGNEFTGTFGVPAVADVQASVQFGAGGTEFSGTFTEPGVGNVEAGVTYGGGGTEFTGTFGVPAETNVATGVNFGAGGTEFTGSASVEAHTNCSSDGDTSCVATATYTAALTTGLADKVLSGQTVAGVGGNVTLPGVGDVESGVSFGVGGNGSTGTFAVPAVADVQSSVTFGAAGSEFTGTFTEPGVGNVEAGVTYGGGGNEFTGTFGVPAVGDVQVSVQYGASGSEFTGTFGVPALAEVETGVTYGGGGNEFTGTATLESHSNCTGANQDGCVATSTYKTLDLSTVSGSGLTAGNFDTSLATASTFEFWDATGARHTVDGDSDLVASNIKDSVEIHGVTGSVTESPADCASNGSQSCVATGSYFAATACSADDSNCFVPTYALTTQPLKAISYDAIDAGKGSMRTSLTLSGITGTLATCSGGNGANCVTTATYPSMDLSAAAETDLTSSNFATALGTASTYEFWDSLGARHTITGDADLTAANLKDGVVIHGVTGDYPSATYPLATNTGATDLTSLGSGTTPGAYEFFDSTGAVYSTTVAAGGTITPTTSQQDFSGVSTVYNGFSVAGDADLVASNIKSSVDIFGVSGSVTESPANCASNGSQSCVATGSYYAATACGANGADTCYLPSGGTYDAADLTNLSAGNVKRGITIAGTTGTFPSSSAPLPRYSNSGASTATTGSDETDLTLFSTQLKTDGTFEFWDSNGQRYTGSGDSDIVAANVREGVSFENLSVTGIVPTTPIATPTGLAATFATGPDRMEVSWDDMSVTGYLLIARDGAAVTWTPTNGQSYGTGSQGSDEVIYVGASQSSTHSGVTAGNTYHYALYSYNANYYYSSVAATLTEEAAGCASLSAGGTWIPVAGDTDYSTADFCVMKYEAKNVSSAPESNAAGTPWVSISQTDSSTECDSLGASYDLISNPQWMTIAANLANVADNWSGASVGSGSLNRGHADGTPNNSLAADSDDNNACSGTGQTCSASTWNLERRTHKLSSGEVIWDLGGNVWEWTSYYNSGGRPNSGSGWTEYNNVTVDGAATLVTDLRPTNSLKSFWNDSWNSGQGIGQYYPETNGSGGALLRGGNWDDGSNAGVFTAALNLDPSYTSSSLGFRCAGAP